MKWNDNEGTAMNEQMGVMQSQSFLWDERRVCGRKNYLSSILC